MEKEKEYAGLSLRIAAFIFDVLVMNMAMALLSVIGHYIYKDIPIRVFHNVGRETSLGISIATIILGYSISLSYSILMIGKYQATLGKIALGIKIVGKNDRRISYGLAAYRETFGISVSILACFMGFIWAAWDSCKQTWHDKLAETYVVYKTKITPKRIYKKRNRYS